MKYKERILKAQTFGGFIKMACSSKNQFKTICNQQLGLIKIEEFFNDYNVNCTRGT